MGQTLKQLRLLAAGMGITLHELIRRRASKSEAVATVDQTGTIRFRPRVLCSRELGGWSPVYGTAKS